MVLITLKDVVKGILNTLGVARYIGVNQNPHSS